MIEQNAGAGEKPEALAVIFRDPVAVELRDAVGTARIERRLLILRDRLHLAEHFRGRGLVEPRLRPDNADRFKQIRHADGVDLCGRERLLPACRDKALRREIVDLIRLRDAQRGDQRNDIGHIRIDQTDSIFEMCDIAEIDDALAPPDAVDLIALFEQQLREIGAVLTGDAGNQCAFFHASSFPASHSAASRRMRGFCSIVLLKPIAISYRISGRFRQTG